MAFPEGAERRWLVFCVSERPDENAALWKWCTTSLFDPHRDSVTFLYCRTEANVILVRRTCPPGGAGVVQEAQLAKSSAWL